MSRPRSGKVLWTYTDWQSSSQSRRSTPARPRAHHGRLAAGTVMIKVEKKGDGASPSPSCSRTPGAPQHRFSTAGTSIPTIDDQSRSDRRKIVDTYGPDGHGVEDRIRAGDVRGGSILLPTG